MFMLPVLGNNGTCSMLFKPYMMQNCIKNSGTFPKSFGTLYLAFLELRTLEIVNS